MALSSCAGDGGSPPPPPPSVTSQLNAALVANFVIASGQVVKK